VAQLGSQQLPKSMGVKIKTAPVAIIMGSRSDWPTLKAAADILDTLNVSFDATSGMQLSNEYIQFKARFGGVARDIVVPMGRVIAIYAKENGQGMAFPAPSPSTAVGQVADTAVLADKPAEPPAGGPTSGARPQLKRIK
jgi:stringent starvation protein B